jgi:hypothetical protein
MVFRDAARRQRYAPNKPASILTTTWSRHPEVSLCFKKSSFKFPVLACDFPVLSKNFPVLLRREFRWKPLNLLVCWGSKSHRVRDL